MTATSCSSTPFYKLEELSSESGQTGFGAKVTGIDLKTFDLKTAGFAEALKEDIKKYRLVVFKDQGKVSGDRQVEISELLGRLESTFYKHPQSPHPDVFRVSNDGSEGCTNVGRTGWHVDGTFQPIPFLYQTMHFHSVCSGGATWFVPLQDVFSSRSPEVQHRWHTMWMMTRGKAHPLVYQHPIRGDTTLLFHCGDSFSEGWGVEEEASEMPAFSSIVPHNVFAKELTQACLDQLGKTGLKLDWEQGDFAINDNVGNAHYASEGTQRDHKEAGLRILHRTTISGETPVTKADGRQSFMMRRR